MINPNDNPILSILTGLTWVAVATAIIGIILYLRRVYLDWKEFNDSIKWY
jgi:hypothetical protein